MMFLQPTQTTGRLRTDLVHCRASAIYPPVLKPCKQVCLPQKRRHHILFAGSTGVHNLQCHPSPHGLVKLCHLNMLFGTLP
jgi:hypothetical protein